MVPIGVQKIESLSSSEKKWQAIENLLHILLEWTLGLGYVISKEKNISGFKSMCDFGRFSFYLINSLNNVNFQKHR